MSQQKQSKGYRIQNDITCICIHKIAEPMNVQHKTQPINMAALCWTFIGSAVLCMHMQLMSFCVR